MTRATFEQWLQGTTLVDQLEGVYRIAVQNEQAQEWLQHRLYETVQRTLAHFSEGPVRLEFIVGLPCPPPCASEPPAARLDFGLTFAQQTAFHPLKMELGRWLPELQYDNLFWSPYLGRAYAFYRHLLIHWTKSLTKKDMPRLEMSEAEYHWTPPFRLSYRQTTRWLGKRNHKIIPGGIYECHTSDLHRRLDQALGHCCQAHTPHLWQSESGQGGRCYYWRPGMLHRLYEEHLLANDISGRQRVKVQVWRNLPLLTPQQVNQLSPFLKEEHDCWLESYGPRFNVSLSEWLTIKQPSLVPYLPAHGRKQLQGQPPANPLLSAQPGQNGLREPKCNQGAKGGLGPEDN
jgi:hypothetical protein